jgi:hypothetical protein
VLSATLIWQGGRGTITISLLGFPDFPCVVDFCVLGPLGFKLTCWSFGSFQGSTLEPLMAIFLQWTTDRGQGLPGDEFSEKAGLLCLCLMESRTPWMCDSVNLDFVTVWLHLP